MIGADGDRERIAIPAADLNRAQLIRIVGNLVGTGTFLKGLKRIESGRIGFFPLYPLRCSLLGLCLSNCHTTLDGLAQGVKGEIDAISQDHHDYYDPYYSQY
jgi:hypothetical protein